MFFINDGFFKSHENFFDIVSVVFSAYISSTLGKKKYCPNITFKKLVKIISCSTTEWYIFDIKSNKIALRSVEYFVKIKKS